ncbi:CopD family protein [Flavobacterium pallidum]|uniref:Protoporphyrinogen IX oxidase n=1 Tax=Flavobacterium pallidum TaxID=2172098 RepID=A0A2S1SF40_9FLAO|nr:CopD family protein [Flavobacterium pallidum]AWI24995.1 protoporphyrinogen IX oxidase [Flavobacterium pallidum]
MAYYNYIKSLHLIFVITWFAGLFYIVRLFVYQIEAAVKPSPEKEILQNQYKIMTYRLWYIITWPSGVLATIFGLTMLYLNPGLMQLDFMQVKFGFVFLLFLYHAKCHQIYLELQRDEIRYTSNFMRLWNEGATIILFAVVFLIIVKDAINWIYGVIGILLFSILIMLGFRFYKKIRQRNGS